MNISKERLNLKGCVQQCQLRKHIPKLQFQILWREREPESPTFRILTISEFNWLQMIFVMPTVGSDDP